MNKFPYEFGTNSIEMVDIFKRIAFSRKSMDNPANYELLSTSTKEKLDVLSFQYYNDPNMYHILGLFNEIYDHTFLPDSSSARSLKENDFRNSKSIFFTELFPTKPIYGDLLVRANTELDDPATESIIEFELDTTSYAYVEEYDEFLRYVKTSNFSNIEQGDFVQLFRPDGTGNWKPISSIFEMARITDYGTSPAKFFFNKETEVSAYRESSEGSQRVYYSGEYQTIQLLNISKVINGNYPTEDQLDLKMSCYSDSVNSGHFCGFSEDTPVRAKIIGHNSQEKYFVVIPYEDFDMNDYVGNLISVGIGIDLCIVGGIDLVKIGITIESVIENISGIANPSVEFLSPTSLLGQFISNNELQDYTFRTVQNQYEFDQEEKSYLKIPPKSIASTVNSEIRRLLKSGRSNETSTIQGISVVGGNASDTINGY